MTLQKTKPLFDLDPKDKGSRATPIACAHTNPVGTTLNELGSHMRSLKSLFDPHTSSLRSRPLMPWKKNIEVGTQSVAWSPAS
jgi:hypothetical protein